MNQEQKIQEWVKDLVEENYYPELRILAAAIASELSDKHGIEFSELEALLAPDMVRGALELEFMEDVEMFKEISSYDSSSRQNKQDFLDPYLKVLKKYGRFRKRIKEGPYLREEVDEAFRKTWPSLTSYAEDLAERTEAGYWALFDLLKTEVYGDSISLLQDNGLAMYGPEQSLQRFLNLHILNPVYGK